MKSIIFEKPTMQYADMNTESSSYTSKAFSDFFSLIVLTNRNVLFTIFISKPVAE